MRSWNAPSALLLAVAIGAATPAAAEPPLPPVSGSRFGKAGKLELAPTLGMSLGDAFFQKYTAGAKAAYHLTNAWSLGAHASYALNTATDSLSICPDGADCRAPTLGELRDLPGRLGLIVGAEGGWTPIYGKIALFGETALRFDMGLVAGIDAIQHQEPGGKTVFSLGGHVGIGQRWFLSPGAAIRIELRDYLYRTRIPPLDGTDVRFENQVMLEAGFSFLLGSEGTP